LDVHTKTPSPRTRRSTTDGRRTRARSMRFDSFDAIDRSIDRPIATRVCAGVCDARVRERVDETLRDWCGGGSDAWTDDETVGRDDDEDDGDDGMFNLDRDDRGGGAF